MPELRDLLERRASGHRPPPDLFDRVLDRRRRRDRNRRGVTVAVAVAVAAAGIGGLLRAFYSDPEPRPAAQLSRFVGTWVSTDLDGSTQTMVVRAAGEGALEIEVRDDSARVCSGAPSTITGTGRVDGATVLVIPSPVLTCDDGSEPTVESGPPLEELLRNLTFVHDREAETLTDNFDVVWGRGKSPQLVPETEVARGVYEGTPWRLNVVTEPGTSDTGWLRGYLGDEIFAGYSWISLDKELEASVAGVAIEHRNPPLGKNGLQDALVVFGAVRSHVARVEFSEGGQRVSAETFAVPAEMGDDFRVFVLFAPFGTDVACTRGSVPTVNCFDREQRIVGLDAAGEIVTEQLFDQMAGRGTGREVYTGHYDGLRVDQPDPDEFVTDGSEGGLSWRLSARRYEPWFQVAAPTPSWSWRCFAFSLTEDPGDLAWRKTSELAGGLGCLNRPGPGWFGEIAQRVEPQRPEVAPVYGAIPSHVDEVEVVLDDGSEIPARIYRPENHSLAYFLAWIPDAYATGSVRFSADGNELGSRRLCAADYRDEAQGFVCYGTPESE
jgi:hypothetical protein